MAPPLQIGRYVLHGEIASGGMASVHFGRLVGTGGFAKTVAIKRLLRALTRVESFKKMILEEARLAARIRHPNVVPPLDVLAEGGELLLVMEYVHGESLSRLLRSAWADDERVPLPVVATILSNTLHGLHAAHEARDEAGEPLGIVHRDVSPQNIIVGADGVTRVIDFGIAKAVTSEEMTVAGTIKGKVPYLAPEQLEGDPATRRTDIYAASVVLWEMLANRRLFDGKDDPEILRQIVTMELPPPSKHNPLVAGSVDDVVLRGLARSPKDRFETAREMALALEAVVHLATASVVGAWVERLAADTLAQRAARIREVEATLPAEDAEAAAPPGTVRMSAREAGIAASSFAHAATMQATSLARPPSRASAPPLPLPPSPPRSPSLPPPRVSAPPPSPAAARPSSPPVRPASVARPVVEPRTVIYEPPPMPEPAFVEGVRPISRDAPLAPPPPAHPPLAPPPAGALRKPDLAIRNVDWLPSQPPKAPLGTAFKRFLRYLVGFLALSLLVAWMFAPAIARAWLVTGASARGIVMTIDRVDVSRRAIRLNDVHLESPDVPGASLRAGTVVIGLRWLAPESILLDEVEVSLDGSYTEIEARLAQYRTKYGVTFAPAIGSIRRIEVTSGRIDWKSPLGASTSALIENISGEVAKTPVRALGDDYRLTAPLVTMTIAGAGAGPWQLDVDRQGILVRTVVHFDVTGTYPASVTRTAADDGSVTLALAVPPTLLSDLHVPAVAFGKLATSSTRLSARGEMHVDSVQQTMTRAAEPGPAGAIARSASGHLVFAAGGLSVFPTGPLVDLSLDVPLAGDASRPLPILAALAIAQADLNGGTTAAAATAALAGSIDLSKRAVRVELAGKSGTIACVKAGAGGGAGAGKGTGLAASIVASLDDYSGAKVTLTPANACMPKLR